jgi:DNA-binding transcriptional LysR family regulator
MELRHLRYFIAAAEEENFGRASDRLHVTRPAVSQIVADLEDELGTPLFERMAHRVKLTAAGRTFLAQLKTIMSDLNQAVVLTKRVGEGKTGVLNIGYGGLTLLHPLFRAAVKQFHDESPDVTLSLLEIASSEQPKALAEGRIHAGFIHHGPTFPGFRRKKKGSNVAEEAPELDRFKIQSGGMGVVLPHDHRLARKKSLTIGDLAEERFIVVARSSVSPTHALFSWCQKAGFEPRIVQEVGTVATMLNLAAVGVGVGLTITGKDIAYPASLAVVPLENVSYTSTFCLAWVKGHTEPALERFVATVKALA